MDKNWENKCHKCGLCCHEKAVYGRELVIDLDSWCEYFDPQTKQCTIYTERFSQSNRCKKMTPIRAMFASYLHENCAYVQWARRYHIRFARKRIRRFIHSKTCSDEDSEESDIYEAFNA